MTRTAASSVEERATARSRARGFFSLILLFITASTARPALGQEPAADQNAPPSPTAAPTSTSTSNPEPSTTAELDATISELMRSGLTAYKKGDYEAARTFLERAWQLEANTEIAASLATVEMKLGRHREAAEHWTYYLRNQPPDPHAAESKLAECRRHLAHIHASLDTPEATVVLDGRAFPASGASIDFWLEPGAHTLYASVQGRTSSVHRLNAEAGTTYGFTLHLEASAVPAAPKPTTVARANDAAEEFPTRIAVLVGGGTLAVVAATLGIVYGLRAHSADRTAVRLHTEMTNSANASSADPSSFCLNPPSSLATTCVELASQTHNAVSWTRTANVAFIGAGILAVGTLVT